MFLRIPLLLGWGSQTFPSVSVTLSRFIVTPPELNSKPWDLNHLHRDHLDAKFDSKNASKPVWWVLSSRKRLVGGTLKSVPVLEQQNCILFLDFGFSGSKKVRWITNRKGTPLRNSAKNTDFGGFWGIRAPPDSVLGRLWTGFPVPVPPWANTFVVRSRSSISDSKWCSIGAGAGSLGIDGAIWNRSVESSLHANSRSSKFSTNHKRFVTCFPPRVRRIKNWNWVTFFTRIVGRHKICQV